MGASLPWTGAVPDIPPGSFDFLGSDLCVATPRGQEAPQSIEDPYVGDSELFLRFFHRLRELEDVALSSLRGISGNTCSRTKRFAPGTFLYSILTTLPDYDHGIRDVRFIDDYTGMACLLFLNVALYACHIKCSDFDRYLDWLDMELNRLNAHATPSITSVLWIFLSNGGYPSGDPGDRGERCWLVSRLLRVAKRLQWKRHGTVWDRLRSTLIEFVSTQQECALGSSQVDGDTLLARQQRRQSKRFSWDEDEMREDILEVNCSDSASSRSDIPTFI